MTDTLIRKRMSTHTQIHTTHTQNPIKKPHETKSAGSKSHSSSMNPPKEEDRLEEEPGGSALDMDDFKQALHGCGKEQPGQRSIPLWSKCFYRKALPLKGSLRTACDAGLPGTVAQGGILAFPRGTPSFLSEHTRGWQPTHLLIKPIQIFLLSF